MNTRVDGVLLADLVDGEAGDLSKCTCVSRGGWSEQRHEVLNPLHPRLRPPHEPTSGFQSSYQ